MNPAGNGGLNWTLEVVVSDPGVPRMQLAASAAGFVYFGGVSTAFTLADSVGD